MDLYLKKFHKEDIIDLLNNNNDSSHVSINVDLNNLQKYEPGFYSNVISNVWANIDKWNSALLQTQKELIEGNEFLEPGYQIKENCHVRFINLPLTNGTFPNKNHVGRFVQIKGNVVRITQSRLLEFKKDYTCSKCKETFIIEAEYSKSYIFEIPRKCLNPSKTCKGTLYPKSSQPRLNHCMDYQELKIQELLSEKNVPDSINVTVDNDLTDICQPGDNVTICGTIERRWRPFVDGKRIDVKICLKAISICKDEEKITIGKDISEKILCVRSQWQDTIDNYGELNARDLLIKSISPEVFGMYYVKLAIALCLCSGIEKKLNGGGINTRINSHLLLIGDPGLAKSKLLKATSKIAVRSVHTSGMGCTSAGLTAAAFKDEGEWQLEGGALVLADGGVCCIDEFNLMRETDKASIHEAMEQQTLSIAKAGIVCKLSTRCVIVAAANPKKIKCTDNDSDFTCIGIASPLLSRFDLVFMLRDSLDIEWDTKITEHLLHNLKLNIENNQKENDLNTWNLERLQSHFLAVRNINPKVTSIANELLKNYYERCRSDPLRDRSRTTVRLLDSLYRLAQSHAKLLFHEYVNSIDAIIVIRLVESSWGFGRLVKSIDIVKTELPIGPNEEQIDEILIILKLTHLKDKIIEELKNSEKIFYNTSQKQININKTINETELQNLDNNKENDTLISINSNNDLLCKKRKLENLNNSNEINIQNLENIFGYHKNVKKIRKSNDNSIQPDNEKSLENSTNLLENKQPLTSTQLNTNNNNNKGIDDWDDINLDDFNDDDDDDNTINEFSQFKNEDKNHVNERNFEIVENLELNVNDSKINNKSVESMLNKNIKISKLNDNNKENLNKCNSHEISLGILDFDDENLEIDINTNKTQIKSLISKHEEQQHLINVPTTSKIEKISTENAEENFIVNKISPKTIKKLEIYKNPNYIDKTLSLSKNEDFNSSKKISSDKNAENNNDDVNSFNDKFLISLNDDDDLSCLDFDL